jgi:hypothetical protein
MVEANMGGRKLYIANGRLWECEYDPENPAAKRWDRSSGLEGFVVDVASTTNVLYALTIDGTSTTVRKKEGTSWPQVSPPSDYGFIQNIFGAGDTLFATGKKNADNYAIYYCKQQNSQFTSLKGIDNVLLSGVGKVGNNYYLATKGKGIYKVSDSDLTNADPTATLESADPANIVGFLQVDDDTIIGVSSAGHTLYINSAAGIKADSTNLGGGTYTGALALMDSPDPQLDPKDPQGRNFDKLLLLGYRGSNSSYQHGYVEVQFNSATGNHEANFRIPGESQPSSIKDDSRQYTSSLRRYPVTALWVLPNTTVPNSPLIFAATSNQGVYSYRDRSDGGWQWNHEE